MSKIMVRMLQGWLKQSSHTGINNAENSERRQIYLIFPNFKVGGGGVCAPMLFFIYS